jgi:hypothetical protein
MRHKHLQYSVLDNHGEHELELLPRSDSLRIDTLDKHLLIVDEYLALLHEW